MKPLYLIFHGRFPSERAAGLFAARSAQAFSRQGRSVRLLVPYRRDGGTAEAARAFYGITEPVEIVYLSAFDLFRAPVPKRIAFWASFYTFSRSAQKYLRAYAEQNDLIYSNESLPLWFASKEFSHCVYEMHDFPEGKLWFFGRFLRRMHRVVVHNVWKTKEVVRRFAIDPARILTEPNAVDTKVFDPELTQSEARTKLNLPEEGRIVVYTGHLYGWKGVATLARAAKMLPDHMFYFVGGTKEEVAYFAKEYIAPHMHWIGFRPHEEIPLWQRAADALVLPNTAREAISAYYTSPMKLFEYLASGTPVIASRIPSVEELVDDQIVLFAEADNPNSFADAIKKLEIDPEAARRRAVRGKEWVATHTWDARAQRILNFVD